MTKEKKERITVIVQNLKQMDIVSLKLMENNSEPVSYTHLDVYKRQIFHSTVSIYLFCDICNFMSDDHFQNVFIHICFFGFRNKSVSGVVGLSLIHI